MSAPKTDLEKQERQHKGPLLGMSVGVVFAVLLLIGLIVFLTVGGNEPGNETPIDEEPGASGASTEAAPE